jgi:hypothetical protein
MTALKNFLKTGVVLCALASLSSHASASTDQGCVLEVNALASNMGRCDIVGALVPENDTRDNLIFLIADRHKQLLKSWPELTSSENQVYYGEGSICVSDSKGGSDFVAAVEADSTIPAEEKRALQTARQGLKCESGASAAATNPMAQTANGKEFEAYLAAITTFYVSKSYDATAFTALSKSNQPWVKEAASYMRARVTLLAAQYRAFDDYGSLDRTGVDAQQVSAALAALNDYLRDYPQGTYAASAEGLKRRAGWIGQDTEQLVAEYSRIISKTPVNEATINIAHEIDHKLTADDHLKLSADPMLVAMHDLMLLRVELDDKGKPLPGMKADFLESQRARFVGYEDLFDYLLAYRAWQVDKDAAAVLRLLPARAPSGDMSYLEFSRQLLRAKAQEATGDKSARDAYLALLPHTTQLFQRVSLEYGLAQHDERQKNISAVFDEKSKITDPSIRERLLDQVAGPIILKQQALSTRAPQDERNVALYRLLARDLTQGRFKGFLEDIKMLPPPPVKTGEETPNDYFWSFRDQPSDTGYKCPPLVTTVSTLANNPKDVRGRLCLGDLFRSQDYALFLEPVEKHKLGGTGTIFGGKVLARQDFYVDIKNDRKAVRDDRAYALYRLVNCYAPVGYNGCGGDSVDKPQRRKWFLELKSSYADTDWAKKLDIYW